MMAASDHCIPSAVFLSLFFLLSLTSLPPPCRAKDTLVPGESIADGQTLVSAGSIFELGFFSPGSSRNRYVGIWYYNFSTDTVLWVANREAPIRDASGSLSVGDDGNLAVLDGIRRVVWSTNSSSSSNASTTTTILQLLDTGNLVLNISGGVAWQSFDHPTDTYLPGMKVGLDLSNNVNQLFTSWRSLDDPAPGNFSMGMDPRRSTQIFLWEGGRPRWRSGRWDGQVFIGIPGMVPNYIYGFRLSNFQQEQKMYFYFNAFNSSHRYVLTWNGMEQHLIWADDSKGWFQYWAQPVTECELYNRCGNNGRCTDGGSGPECACLKGYVPAAEEEWRNGNWTSGCVRRTALQCERNGSVGGADGFWKMEGVKLPDLSEWDEDVVDEDGCRAACLGNCSCTAYAYVVGIRCLVWGGDLVDIHVFSGGGNDLYLRLASSELENKNKVPKYVIVLIALAVITAIGFIYLLLKYNKRINALLFERRGRVIASVNPSGDRDQMSGRTRSFHIVHKSNDPKCQEQLPLFSFELILTSTLNFSRGNFLGEGGFGPVYKGILPEGQEVAIKRLSRSSGQGQDEFKNEVILIAKLQHRNLVRLLGCCVEGEEKLLVYEYMPNKSLDVFLFDPRRKGMLDWKTRYNILEGIARGLVYLHRDSRLRIIHRDLKASNILLDKNMDPKISDFGMARIFRSEQNEANRTKVIMGTIGYMSPEYAMQGVFSVKSDVYSFGVLLLEIVSGKKNSSFMDEESSLNLLGYAWKLWNEDNVMEFVDPAIRDSCSLEQVSRCVNVGLLCVQDRANDRPTMSTVIVALESGTAANPQPRQPTFAAERGPSDTESSTFHGRNTSRYNSITLLVGR